MQLDCQNALWMDFYKQQSGKNHLFLPSSEVCENHRRMTTQRCIASTAKRVLADMSWIRARQAKYTH
ncbi:hypothetical protein GCM10008090_00320 [Arenicella chitinivorans]|uniref:Uncharacterized protein n=1 Tax=Arenicella chitinivorans TaxID=1329800 RepID=A0A918VG22_9GAMM|nr:hypothetical protein GCM10008090_00320 [Arenicella chitinivorans]